VLELDDPAGEHGPARLESLAGDLESELVEAAGVRQVNTVEPGIRGRRDGSVGHVEVFQVKASELPSLGDLDPIPARRAEHPAGIS